MDIETILSKLKNKESEFDHLIWVGKKYTLKDLKDDLRSLLDDNK